MTTTGATGTSATYGDRLAKVQAAVRAWKSQLVDLGGRNTLLYFRDQKVGTLDLSRAEPQIIDALLGGRTVRLSSLFGDPVVRTDALKRARAIFKKAKEHNEERGILTLFVACGFATWHNERTASPPRAPVLLRGASLSPRGAALEEFDLVLSGEMEVNPTLTHLLDTEFGRKLDIDALLERIDGVIDTREELDTAYEWLRQHAEGIKDFGVTGGMVLGNFSYAKLPMVADLDRSEAALAAHEIIASIAGDTEARAQLSERYAAVQVSLEDPDRTPPADEYLVLDADATQNYAINAALNGQDLIVKGPPGTGKSQTIANLIATAMARGKTVLFVAEKRAAIEAVYKRLQDEKVGLGDLILDLHGGAGRRREFAASLARSLEMVGAISLGSYNERFATLAHHRDVLNGQASAMHDPRVPWGVSVYSARVRAASLPQAARSDLRLRREALPSIDGPTFDRLRQELLTLAELGAFSPEVGHSPWARVQVLSPEQTMSAFEIVDRLASATLPRAAVAVEAASAQTRLPVEPTIDGWMAAVSAWRAARDALTVFRPAVVGPGVEQALLDYAPAHGGSWSRLVAGLTNRRYRAARSRVRALLLAPTTSDAVAHAALVRASEATRHWQERAGGMSAPPVPANLDEVAARVQQCVLELSADAAVAQLLQPRARTVVDLAAILDRLRADRAIVIRLPQIGDHWRRLATAGLGELLDELRASALQPDLCVARFDHVWLHSVLQRVEFDDPRVGAFDSAQHSRIAEEFRTLDDEHIQTTPARIRRLYAERVVAARDKYPGEAALIAQQAARKRGHMPLRALFSQAPNVLLALKPCWAMSPLVVSQVLPSERRYFDIVVFDEASQVTPADAVPAILRGKRLVVAGDDKQLPPTAFFASQAPEDDHQEEESVANLAATTGFESILDTLTVFLRQRMLTWHYRSRDERLIAFSNAHFYDRSLTTFPGTVGESIDHVLVPFREGRTGQEQSAADEVQKVVQLVLDHATGRPRQTLGVIAMGITHANRIDEALREALTTRSDLDEFFSDTGTEPFFVKNLERVQGDERDAIILSIGYGKTADGRLLYRFGPLNLEGGERRLNVAVTRAKERMTIVSSFSSSELDPARSSARGVRVLKEYLRYAETRGADLGDRRLEGPALNAFEIQVLDALVSSGIRVTPQLGVSGYRIDFAAEHPQRPGRHVLAIECDGASYHSSPTARDRDRLRQEHLERLGWRFHRIWSGEWFSNRERALSGVIAAYQRAVVESNESRPSPPSRVRRSASAGAAPSPTGVVIPVDRAARRGPRPPVPRYGKIADYSRESLIALATWIESDTLLRTEDELISLLIEELGFQRRGSKIVIALEQAVHEARTRTGHPPP